MGSKRVEISGLQDVDENDIPTIPNFPRNVLKFSTPLCYEEPQVAVQAPAKKRKIGDDTCSILRTLGGTPPSKPKFTPQFIDGIAKGEKRIYCNRPLDPSNLPLGLVNRIFGEFRDSSKTIQPSAKDNQAFLELRQMMLAVYECDKERETCFITFFWRYTGIHLQPGTILGTSSLSSGHAFAVPMRFIHILIVVKNEIVNINVDPYLQASMIYKDYLSRIPVNYQSKSNFPLMVVLVIGKCSSVTVLYLKN